MKEGSQKKKKTLMILKHLPIYLTKAGYITTNTVFTRSFKKKILRATGQIILF